MTQAAMTFRTPSMLTHQHARVCLSAKGFWSLGTHLLNLVLQGGQAGASPTEGLDQAVKRKEPASQGARSVFAVGR